VAESILCHFKSISCVVFRISAQYFTIYGPRDVCVSKAIFELLFQTRSKGQGFVRGCGVHQERRRELRPFNAFTPSDLFPCYTIVFIGAKLIYPCQIIHILSQGSLYSETIVHFICQYLFDGGYDVQLVNSHRTCEQLFIYIDQIKLTSSIR